jgi:ferrochelatase
MPIQIIDCWYDFAPYVDALVEVVREGLKDLPGATVLFSAHGLPVKLIRDGDPYLDQIKGTVAAVTAKLPEVPWELAFQSRTGPVRWLDPSTPDVIRKLAGQGVRDVLVVPVSFVSDHIETLHELDIEYGHLAQSLGIREFRRSPSLNLRPGFISALAALVEAAIEKDSWQVPPAVVKSQLFKI